MECPSSVQKGNKDCVHQTSTLALLSELHLEEGFFEDRAHSSEVCGPFNENGLFDCFEPVIDDTRVDFVDFARVNLEGAGKSKCFL